METIQAVSKPANDTTPPRVLSAPFADRLAAINRAVRVLRAVGLPVASVDVALSKCAARIELAIPPHDQQSRDTAEFQVTGGVMRVTRDGKRLAFGSIHGVQVVWDEPLMGEDASSEQES